MTFGEYIRHLRLMRRTTVDDLAADADLRLGHLMDIEADNTAPSLQDIWKLAAALDVPEEELIEEAPRVRPDAF